MRECAWHVAAAVLLGALAVGQTWPLIGHLGTGLPGQGAGDNVTFVWNLWWLRHAGAGGFFHTDYVLWPFGASLVLHTHTALNGVLAATLLDRLSVIEAQNVLVLVSVFLNAIAAYALAYDVTRSRRGAIAAATIFGGSPYFAAHLEGHFNLIVGWVIPVWILFARRAALGRKAKDGVLAGCALALVAYADYSYFVFSVAAALCMVLVHAGILCPVCEPRRLPRTVAIVPAALAGSLAALTGWVYVTGGTTLQMGVRELSIRGTFNPRVALWAALALWALLRWRIRFRASPMDRASIRAHAPTAAIVAAVCSVAVVPLVVQVIRVAGNSSYVGPALYFRSATPGLDVAALVGGNPRHPIVGLYSRRFYHRLHIDPIEGVGWLGVVPVALAILGWRRWPDRRERRAWGLLLGVFLFWSLGPFLTILSWNTALVLPQTLLRFVPIVSNARMPGRAIVVVYLSMAMLSAMGLAANGRRSTWATAMLIGLIVVDYASAPAPLWNVEVPSVYRVLAARADRDALLELPMGFRDGFGGRGDMDPGSPLFQTVHEHPVVGGFVARIPSFVTTQYLDDAVFGPLLRASEPSSEAIGLPAAGTLRDGLLARGVRYVMLRRSAASPSMTTQIEAALGPFLLAGDGDRELFDVRAR